MKSEPWHLDVGAMNTCSFSTSCEISGVVFGREKRGFRSWMLHLRHQSLLAVKPVMT